MNINMAANGITYYKLNSKYEGDETKYCAISSNELDSNFYFLRGIKNET